MNLPDRSGPIVDFAHRGTGRLSFRISLLVWSEDYEKDEPR
jgi:hypothetical protein